MDNSNYGRSADLLKLIVRGAAGIFLLIILINIGMSASAAYAGYHQDQRYLDAMKNTTTIAAQVTEKKVVPQTRTRELDPELNGGKTEDTYKVAVTYCVLEYEVGGTIYETEVEGTDDVYKGKDGKEYVDITIDKSRPGTIYETHETKTKEEHFADTIDLVKKMALPIIALVVLEFLARKKH